MAGLAASDVTLTVQSTNIQRKQRRTLVKIAFGDGALTYPSGGVPLPTAPTSWGLRRSLDYIVLNDANDGSGIVWKYDRENKKLRGYISGITVSAAGAATVDDFALDTTAEPLATAVSLSLTNNTGAGVKYLGSLIELTTTHAPAAQVLYCEAVGA